MRVARVKADFYIFLGGGGRRLSSPLPESMAKGDFQTIEVQGVLLKFFKDTWYTGV